MKLLANYSLNCTLVSPITITNSASNSSEIKMKKIYIFKHNPNPLHPPPSPIPLALGRLPLTLKLTTPSLKNPGSATEPKCTSHHKQAFKPLFFSQNSDANSLLPSVALSYKYAFTVASFSVRGD